MKKFLMFVLVVLAFQEMAVAQGSIFEADKIVRINSSDSVETQLIATGKMVEIAGWIENDLFAASRQFILDGSVGDDAIIAAQMVAIYGQVNDMLVTAGETVIIDGVVQGDLFAAGRDVQIAEKARIEGDAFIAGGTITFEGGHIEGNLRIAGAALTLNGTVNNTTTIYSDEVTFGEQYNSSYGTTITSSEPLHRENLGAIPANLTLKTEEQDVWAIIIFQVWFFLSLLITGLILIRLFQKSAVDMSKFARERFWVNTGWGVLTFLAVPIAIVILTILVITIPLSVVVALTYALALFVSYLLVAMSLGAQSITFFTGDSSISTYYWGLALGMLYIAILTNIPYIGGLLNVFLLFFGLGSLGHYLWEISAESRNRATGT